MTALDHDPVEAARDLAQLDGLTRPAGDDRRRAPAAADRDAHGLRARRGREGRVVFAVEPGEQHYNPIGMVHGGLAATLIDSATGCAVHTTLPAGTGYTTTDVQVRFVRPITRDTGRIECIGDGRARRAHARHGRGARHGRRAPARPRHGQPAHPATGRSNRVDSTTCVWVLMIPGVSRMRSSASSRCWVSRARTCRIALASPATV